MLNTNKIWLEEPAAPDNTFANRLEHPLDWLKRSTVPNAIEGRRFINELLGKLPQDLQEQFYHALHKRWDTAFFELIVYCFLQELGGTIQIEESLESGRKPDFLTNFSDGTILVEATFSDVDREWAEIFKNRAELLDFIEQNIPEGWSLGVSELPDIGPSDSKKEFKSAVKKMLAIAPPDENAEMWEAIEPTSKGDIKITLLPKPSADKRLQSEPPFAGFDPTRKKIEQSVTRKRKQVRGATMPAVVALTASGLFSEFEDFDRVLFGSTFARMNSAREIVETGFTPDGLFTTNLHSGEPTIAAVLAFLPVGFAGGAQPVLYIHPRFTGKLPGVLLDLEQRSYDETSNSIVIVPAKRTDLLTGLNFCSL